MRHRCLTGVFNVGDLDQDNLLDVTETWQYTASPHVVTQAEIDAGMYPSSIRRR